MNDIKKAKKLVSKYKLGQSISPVVNDRMYDAVLEMAEWKDEEFNLERKALIEKIDSLKEQRAALRASNEKFRKEFLGKACNWLTNYFVYEHEGMTAQGCGVFLELFREAMNKDNL